MTDPVHVTWAGRVLAGDAALVQVWFHAAVLDRYRGLRAQGTRVMRTNSVGRVQVAAGWSLDFGIAGGEDGLIHLAAADLAQRLPRSEHDHWARHMVSLPVSPNFLLMRMHPGSCLDDGDLRDF